MRAVRSRFAVLTALTVATVIVSAAVNVANLGAAAPDAPLSAQQVQQIYRPAPDVQMMPTRPLAQQIAASPDAGFAANMTYHGGPVQQPTANSVPIFWFPSTLQSGASATPAADYISLVERYFDDVGGSPLYEVNTQYYQTVNGPTQFIVNRSLQALAVIDTSPYPAHGAGCGAIVDCVDNSQIIAEATKVVQAHGLPQDLTTEYFVFTAPHESTCFNTTTCFKSDTQTSSNFAFCAYHSYFDIGVHHILYANMPYSAFTAGGNNSCTGLSQFPNSRDADIEISITSHEQMETVTDPLLDAWYSGSVSGENGDLCAYNYGTRGFDGGLANEQWNGHFYVVQQEWSNAINGCTQGNIPSAPATDSFTKLTPLNGWTNSPSGTSPSAAALRSGIVYLKGAISTAGTNAQVFTLPPNLRPATNVNVPIDVCDAAKGRLLIQPTGRVTVQTKGPFADAQCFTSLDGVSYALAAPTLLTPLNGWTNAPSATSNASAVTQSQVVHLKGAVANGTSSRLFTLPVAFRPATNVYVPVDLCGAKTGRLLIQPSGAVFVQPEGVLADAQCLTSLDGASYVLSGAAALTPLNGWTNGPLGTGNAAASSVSGIVHLQGAIATTGTNALAFTLPDKFRPPAPVFVAVSMCNATKGHLVIRPTGNVTVQAETAFSNAQCFTGLDGVSYASVTAFDSLALQNGWANAPLGTRNAAVSSLSGIVYFKGAISTAGTNPTAFTLPAFLRPATNVYVPVDLCNSAKGDLLIQSTGTVTVRTKGPFADAQCFTSLDGVSFARTAPTLLTLQNGWANAPSGTSNAAAVAISGIVHLKGAIASGTNAAVFTLPVALRPTTNVFVPVDLCSAANGRLQIQPNGVVRVQAETAFTDAQCFTSLDGVSYVLSGATALTPQNGWTNAPSGTSNSAFVSLSGTVHLKGAIATAGTNPVAFTLPTGLRPARPVYVAVDVCAAHNGRLFIQPSGVVTVQTEGAFSTAQCMTSLDGARYSL